MTLTDFKEFIESILPGKTPKQAAMYSNGIAFVVVNKDTPNKPLMNSLYYVDFQNSIFRELGLMSDYEGITKAFENAVDFS